MEMKKLSSYFEKILEKLKVQYPDTLFPLDWNALKEGRCPICYCKLYQVDPLNHGVWRCKSVKHKRTFAIKDPVYKSLQKELQEKQNVR